MLTEGSVAVPTASKSRLARALSVEWLGQMVASLCWMVSMLVYGIQSPGDWLQMGAATAWSVANIASLLSSDAATTPSSPEGSS
ncbi:MAG: hypothetical protein AAF928_04260 [Myxococcota bacterium]